MPGRVEGKRADRHCDIPTAPHPRRSRPSYVNFPSPVGSGRRSIRVGISDASIKSLGVSPLACVLGNFGKRNENSAGSEERRRATALRRTAPRQAVKARRPDQAHRRSVAAPAKTAGAEMEPRIPSCHPGAGGAVTCRVEVRLKPLAGLYYVQAHAGGPELRCGAVRRPRTRLSRRAGILLASRQGRRRLGL